jgi:adenylate kinase family enzyme
VNRVVIVGTVGSGKTTFAVELGRLIDVPHLEKDALLRGGDDTPEHRLAVDQATSGSRWVFDGTPFYVEDLVYGRADTIVVLDYSLPVVMWRVVRRSVRLWRRSGTHSAQTPEPPWRWVRAEHPVRWAWSTHSERRKRFEDLVTEQRGRKGVHVFRRPKEARRWMDSVVAGREASNVSPSTGGDA